MPSPSFVVRLRRVEIQARLRRDLAEARLHQMSEGGYPQHFVNRFVLVFALGLVAVVSGQERGLGNVTFPNSGSAAAQADFIRGVAWLHSFMYEDAIDSFRAAQKIDPSFALAYWGEAMSFSQPLWFFEEVEKGRAVLAKLGATPAARLAKAKNSREQGFLRAVEALFGPGDTRARAAAHAKEMANVVAANPADDDAQTFYALALLATLPRGDAALPLRQQAVIPSAASGMLPQTLAERAFLSL